MQTWKKLIPFVVAALLAGCAPSTQPANLGVVDKTKLSSAGRRLLDWKPMFDNEDKLTKQCLLQTGAPARSQNFSECFSTPILASAQEVKFPLMPALNVYMAKVKDIVIKADANNTQADELALQLAAPRDVLLVATHRYLNENFSMSDGMVSSYEVDKDVDALKKDNMSAFLANTNMNRLMALYQAEMMSRARQAAVASLGEVPSSFERNLEMDANAKAYLSNAYYTNVKSFFTNEDLEHLNKLYGDTSGQLLQIHEQQAIVGLLGLEQQVTTRKLAKGMAITLQKISDGEKPFDLQNSQTPVNGGAK